MRETLRTCTSLPLAFSTGAEAEEIATSAPQSVLATLAFPLGPAVLHDATVLEDVRQCLLKLIEGNATLGDGGYGVRTLLKRKDRSRSQLAVRQRSNPQERARGTVRHRNTTCSRGSRPRREAAFHCTDRLMLMLRAHFQASESSRVLESRVGSAEQSNTSIIYGNQLILKLFRRLQPGENPDVEIGRFLTEVARFPHIPPFLGEIAVTQPDGKKTTAAMLQGLVANQGDGWHWFLGRLAEVFPRSGRTACATQCAGASIWPRVRAASRNQETCRHFS